MPKRQARRSKCELCGRRILHGHICSRCRAEVQRELHQARLDGRVRVVGYHGTVREMRDVVLPALRRAAMQGLTLRQAVRIQRRLDAIMVGEEAS